MGNTASHLAQPLRRGAIAVSQLCHPQIGRCTQKLSNTVKWGQTGSAVGYTAAIATALALAAAPQI